MLEDVKDPLALPGIYTVQCTLYSMSILMFFVDDYFHLSDKNELSKKAPSMSFVHCQKIQVMTLLLCDDIFDHFPLFD